MSRLDEPHVSRESMTRARTDLQAEADALEAEVVRNRERLAALSATNAAAERRAMEAIQAGRDREARAALLDQTAVVEEAATIEADIRVLTALLAECRVYLAGRSGSGFDGLAEPRCPPDER